MSLTPACDAAFWAPSFIFTKKGLVSVLVISPTAGDQSALARDHRAGVAFVFVARPPRFIDADAVVSDNAGGAAAAVAPLAAAGPRRIGFLGDPPEIPTPT